ncbi:MAG: TfoX/Sxy family protein [Paracoccaceae bacterium]
MSAQKPNDMPPKQTDENAPVSAIRNLGPASEDLYARAGIKNAAELRALGPDEAYLRLLRNGSRPHFIAYYALVMGLQGRPWNDCKGAEKAALRKKFDVLKAMAKKPGPDGAAPGLPEGIARFMDQIGLRAG